MKEKILLAVLLAIAAGVGIAAFLPGKSQALHVNDVGGDPGAYTGTVTLVGITAGFAEGDNTLFGIMDLKKLQCKATTCNRVILPVRYAGELPELGDEVVMQGTFVRDGGRYYFASERVEVVANHKLGG